MLSGQVIYPAAILCYLLLVAGIVVFVIMPALQTQEFGIGFLLKAAFFGLVVYGVYDLTCLALFKHYTVKATIVDMIWGSSLSALISYITIKVVS